MKHSFLRLCIIALMMLITTGTYAYDVEVDGIAYNLNTEAKTAEVTSKYTNYSGSVVIPENVSADGIQYKVTSIGDDAFFFCSSLTSINIPNSVTAIGEWAFYVCSSLTSITLGNSVTAIGNRAFYKCSSLTSINIPNSVTAIGESAFYDCM